MREAGKMRKPSGGSSRNREASRGFSASTRIPHPASLQLRGQSDRPPADSINSLRRHEGKSSRGEASDTDLQRVAVLHRHMLAHEREGVVERLALDDSRLTNLVGALE